MSKLIKEAKKEGSETLTLEHLRLTDDVVDKLVSSLPQLSSLKLLDCQLKQVPFELAKLTCLESLQLEQNQLETFPFVPTWKSSILYIGLSQNKISKFPPSLLEYERLNRLTLDHNAFDVLSLDQKDLERFVGENLDSLLWEI
jgi:leucine-rich repeat protein SHOC2